MKNRDRDVTNGKKKQRMKSRKREEKEVLIECISCPALVFYFV